MAELVSTTFDRVPNGPRGVVRDLRVRRAFGEAGPPYRNASTPFRERSAEPLAHQPFGRVPWLTDGDLAIFESGATLPHLADESDRLWRTCSARSIVSAGSAGARRDGPICQGPTT